MPDAGARAIWRSRGLRRAAAVAAIASIVSAGLFALLSSEATQLLTESIDRSLTEQLSLLAARPPEMLPFMIASRAKGGPDVVTTVGLFTADRDFLIGALGVIPPDLALDGRAHEAVSAESGIAIRAAGKALEDGRLLVVARDASAIAEVRGDLASAGIRLALPFLAATLAAGLLIGLFAERRLRRINQIAEQIIEGDIARRLPARPNGDELDRLCAIFNRVLSRLEEGIDALRDAGENIAHDLRTPLTSVRAKLERGSRLSKDGSEIASLFEQAVAGIDHTLATVTALLRIADLEQGRRKGAFASCEVQPMLRDVVETFAPVAEERGLALEFNSDTQAKIHGDRDLLVEAFANLIDNALKFTPSGGRVCVEVTETPRGPIIAVMDTGPGIPVEMRQRVLDRFVKLDTSRHTIGHGLGLSLVKAICQLHDFNLKIEGEGGGASIAIECFRVAGLDGGPE